MAGQHGFWKKKSIILKRGAARRDISEDRWAVLLATGQRFGWESEFPISQYADVELNTINHRDARTLGNALQWYASDPDGAVPVRETIDEELAIRLPGSSLWPIEEIETLRRYADFLTGGACEIERN